MTKTSRGWLNLVPYFGLAIAISLSSWSFIRSAQYRAETDIIFTQTYEIQWRAFQIREKLANIIGSMRLSIETGNDDPRLVKEISLLKSNISGLRDLGYVGKFLEPQEIDRLDKSQMAIETKIIPSLDGSTGDESILGFIYEIQQDIFQVFGAAEARSRTRSETVRIEEDALRDAAIFATALSALIVVGVIIRQRAVFAERQRSADPLLRVAVFPYDAHPHLRADSVS